MIFSKIRLMVEKCPNLFYMIIKLSIQRFNSNQYNYNIKNNKLNSPRSGNYKLM